MARWPCSTLAWPSVQRWGVEPRSPGLPSLGGKHFPHRRFAKHLYLELMAYQSAAGLVHADVAHALPARLPWQLGFLEPPSSQLACLQGLACQLAVQVRVLQGLDPRSAWLLCRQSLRHLLLQPRLQGKF